MNGWNIRFKIGLIFFKCVRMPPPLKVSMVRGPIIKIWPLLLCYVIDPGPAPRSLLRVFQLDRGFGDISITASCVRGFRVTDDLSGSAVIRTYS